ncbi:MAG TPA: cyclic nucleotide-binding domain-containing protein [Chthoniobacterales bacterium]
MLETQRAAVTVVVFLGTFLISLGIGRVLKRRAGVRFGVFFQLFCLCLAFYAALAAWGVHASWNNHVVAALVLLSTGVIVALVNRYVWDLYFEQRRQTTIPHFLREVVALVLFMFALFIVLSADYHAERELNGLLAGSGVVAIIIGFAGQNFFGGIIAGISLQINRPYKVGDWLHMGENYAEVMEINWRSTRLRTNDNIYLDIPNNEIVRQTIINLHYPTEVHAMRIRIGIDYNVPPNRVKDALFRAASNAANVLKDPPVKIFLVDFADHAVTYEIKYYMGNHAKINETNDSVRTNVWYELKRQHIAIPYPIRTVQVERSRRPAVDAGHEEAGAILRGEPIFQCLSDLQIENLVKRSHLAQFGRNERIIEEGAAGDSMFILLQGSAQVSVSKNGLSIPLATLQAGDCFGEMSLLTGELRSATVRAQADCQVMEIGKAVMGEIIRETPECLRQLSDVLATRKLEGDAIVKEMAGPDEHEKKKLEYRATFLARLHKMFSL